MKTFALGDLHGNERALREVLAISQFNYNADRLIFLGDLADGLPHFGKCLDIFSSISHFVPIIGNHDYYLMQYVKKRKVLSKWNKIGADKTLPYITPAIKNKLGAYFKKSKYFFTQDESFFCHGGVNHKKPIKKQKKFYFCKNRKMYNVAKVYDKRGIQFSLLDYPQIKKFFIGHNTIKGTAPEFLSNLINLDTGSGTGGKLTLMNIKNHHYYQK